MRRASLTLKKRGSLELSSKDKNTKDMSGTSPKTGTSPIKSFLQRTNQEVKSGKEEVNRNTEKHVVESIYLSLPLHKTDNLSSSSHIVSFSGPNNGDTESNFEDVVAACVSSTYPHFPDRPTREADPVCDAYNLKVYENKSIISLADGCAWGTRSQEAAIRACNAFINYMDSHINDIQDTRDAGHFLLRAFDKASREIIAGKDIIWDAGTTTLLGGIVLKLVDDKWCFLCANVGDCKAFLYSKSTNQIHDITAGNRSNVTDASDPGGRLGPWLQDGSPDLRNLKLYYSACEPGDIIFVVSDGVHDNLDPQQLGKLPSEFNIKCNTWQEAEKKYPLETSDAKNKFRVKILQEKFKEITDYQTLQPKLITHKLMDHCREITNVSRQYMIDNPNKRLPNDYSLYPGKMDHSSILSIRVGFLAPKSSEDRDQNNEVIKT